MSITGVNSQYNKVARECRGKLISVEFQEEYIKELFRSLRSKIEANLKSAPDRSIVVTSLEAHAGKSTISSNLAIAFAQKKRKTLLIDGDLRCGMLHYFFSTQRMPGLADILSDSMDITETSVHEIIQKTQIPYLSIINAGRYVSNPAELLGSERFRALKKIISSTFEIIIFDSPPFGIVIDAMAITDVFSKYVIVVNAGKTNVLDLVNKINEFPELKEKVLGLVLNNASLDRKLTYYRKSHYYK